MLGLVGVCCLLAVSVSGAEATRGALDVMARAIDNCGGWSELGNCLKVKAVALLDRALSSGPIPITEYIELAPQSGVNVSSPVMSEEQVAAMLPQDRSLRESVLDNMINRKAEEFVKSRTFKLTMPTEVTSEGRKKSKNKGGGGGMMIGLFFLMMVQAAMAKIALLAGKALIVGKIALVIAAVVGMKKLFSGGGESHQVVYADHHHARNGREDAHELAYAAQARAFR